MNWLDAIIQILSNHRHPHHSNLPQTLTKLQLTHLLKTYPATPNQQFPTGQLQDALNELIARGEILSGLGKRYCMTPPSVFTNEEKTTNNVRFQGDRAYLSLAHQILETNQDHHEVLIRPKTRRLESIRDLLAHVGVRVVTFSQLVNHLPKPHKLSKHELRSRWSDNPFASKQTKQTIWRYTPQIYATQAKRWQLIETQPAVNSLIRLHSGDYLWYDTQTFYELEPDTALLTTFWLDQEQNLPLKLSWDSSKGLLHLTQTLLPSAYARQIWALSEPSPDHYRTRYVPPVNCPLVIEALQQVGCQLV
ncbi:MAG: hypothetical protein F6K42_05710 [Leptolyngbya sp. SIO1D8]|nr:hypothetical protein [Leptolyngbya sp. SIO1D8]